MSYSRAFYQRLAAAILAGAGSFSPASPLTTQPTIPSLNVITIDLTNFNPTGSFPGWDGSAPSQSTTAAYPTDRDLLILGHSMQIWTGNGGAIKGGRNVMLKGGCYNFDPVLSGFTGNAAREGVLTRYSFAANGIESGDTNVMLPAASSMAASTIMSLCCRSENVDGFVDGLHGDVFQMPSQYDSGGFSGTPAAVIMERCTGTTAYQGLFLPNQHFDTSASYGTDPYKNSVKALILKKCNFRKTRQYIAQSTGLTTDPAGIKLITLIDNSTDKRGDRPYPKYFSEVYVEPFGAEGLAGCLYPGIGSGTNPFTGANLDVTVVGNTATYPAAMLMLGSIIGTAPPRGDFAPAADGFGVGGLGIPGIGYISPGYSDAPAAPSLSSLAITGTAQQGVALTASATASGGSIVLYQWFADTGPVQYGPSAVYTPTAADVGKVITCAITAVGPGGYNRSVTPATGAVAAPPVPSFDPLTQFTGLVAWLDPNVDASVTLSGSNITQIADQKNGYVYAQNGTVALPTITTGAAGINGRKAMSFSSAALTCVNAAISAAFTGTNKPWTQAFVVKPSATTSSRIIGGLGAGSSQNGGDYASISSSRWNAGRQLSGTAVNATEASGTANTNAHVVIAVYDGTTLTLYVDTVASSVASNASVSQASHTAANHTIGNWQPAAAQPSASFYAGLIGDVLIGSTALSGSTLTDLMAWLKYRAGI